MFCPTCGKDNPADRKFCSSCGTNLEAVSQALSGHVDSALVKFDSALDQFMARYSERYFKNAPATASEPGLLKSWKILGESFLTAIVDVFLMSLMWQVIPFRFVALLITTPIRAISKDGRRKKTAELEGVSQPITAVPLAPKEIAPPPSVTEHTTEIISSKVEARRN